MPPSCLGLGCFLFQRHANLRSFFLHSRDEDDDEVRALAVRS